MKSFRRELERFYGDQVYFAHIDVSRKDVMCFKEVVSFINCNMVQQPGN